MFFIKKNKSVHSIERPGLVTVNNPMSVVSEQFRTIRTNIQFSMVDKDLKTIVVTSAGPGSGKSTIASNLAATMASEEKRVLLVDADLRKPTVHKTFRSRNTLGLTSLLTDNEKKATDAIFRTHVDNLFVLTSGPIPPNPAELLGSKRMNTLMTEMTQLFDLVIFDMPPIVAVTDAQVMASKVDGTLFIIPQGLASKEEVLKAKDLLEMVGANVIGAIMNRVAKEDDKYAYYYGNKE